ncbi:MAG: hypothetical protein JXR94_06050 [Candidatus Hydrogenedentes bacterium]|nr:hypothetical protein [Candidatus Hydrogenedentota bacterium]
MDTKERPAPGAEGQSARAADAPARGPDSHGGVLFLVAVALLTCLIAFSFVHMASQFPYYFMGDMDFVVAKDLLLIHSGEYPECASHPSFGMFLPYLLTQQAAHALGPLSILSFQDLAESLNPLAAMAEFTAFMRAESPIVALAITLLLWSALVVVFRPSRAWCLLILAALGTQQSLLYHASMIRSEFFGVLYWAAALWAVALAVRMGRPGARLAWLFLAGSMIGLCFLSKIQLLFLLPVIPGLLLFARPELIPGFRQHGEGAPPSRRRALAAAALSLVNAGVFLNLLMAALATPREVGVFTFFALETGPTHVLLLVLLAMAGLIVLQSIVAWRPQAAAAWFAPSLYATLMTSGFVASFAAHFLCYADPAKSWTYLSYDFSFLFLIPGLYRFASREFGERLADLALQIRYNPAVFGVHLAALALLILSGRSRADAKARTVAVAMSALAALNALFAARFYLRDLLLVEVMTNLLTCCYLLAAVRTAGRARRAAGMALLAVLFLFNVNAGRRMIDRLDAECNQYGWRDSYWSEVVFGRDDEYTQFMRARYPDGFEIALEHANRFRDTRRLARFVLKNRHVSQRHIGVVAGGFPVWTDAMDWRIASYPERLAGAVLVDSAAAPPRSWGLLHREHVIEPSWHLDKFTPDGGQEAMAVLSRLDIEVIVFVAEPDLGLLHGPQFEPTGEIIRLARDGEQLGLSGVRVKAYAEVPVNELTHRHFIVIRPSRP